MTFDRPLALLLLLFVQALVALWLYQDRRRQADASRFASLALVPNLVSRNPGEAPMSPARRIRSIRSRSPTR